MGKVQLPSVQELKAEIEEYQRKIAGYKSELASCGLFAGKRKKELKEQIAALERDLAVDEHNLRSMEAYEKKKEMEPRRAAKQAEIEQKVFGYLENAAALRENGYTIQRDVSPAVYNADELVREEIAAELLAPVPDYFSVNKFGKPISFVISKDGKEKLLVVVFRKKYGQYTLLYWIDLWAEANNVPLIKLYSYGDTSEEYVMGRVYEELHLR